MREYPRAPKRSVLGRGLGRGRRRRRGGLARARRRAGLRLRLFPALRDVLHRLVDEQAVAVALAVRRRQLPRAGHDDLVGELVGRDDLAVDVDLDALLVAVLPVLLFLGQVLGLVLAQLARDLDDPDAALAR